MFTAGQLRTADVRNIFYLSTGAGVLSIAGTTYYAEGTSVGLTVGLAVPPGVTLAVPVSFDFQTVDVEAGRE